MRKFNRFAPLLLAACILASSCSQSTPLSPIRGPDKEPGAAASASFGQFTDIPVPTESQMDLERTFVLGQQDSWIGRLVFDSSHSATQLFDFYRDEMGKFDWKEITLVRSEISILSYRRGSRVATIQIRPATLRGANVIFVASPEEMGTGTSPVDMPEN